VPQDHFRLSIFWATLLQKYSKNNCFYLLTWMWNVCRYSIH